MERQNVLRPEILAPAGDAEMLRAAVCAGADAVYLGLKRYNARRSAGNFDAAGLAGAAAFCRARGVRVYLALNTVLAPDDLSGAQQAIAVAADAGVDALIVQDLAVAALAKRMAPTLHLHASTQMSVHSLAGAKQAATMGFSRVILARELSLAEIAHIAQNCGIETEVFIHGALCMSVSGQCYLSAFLGGRSGNRGACAGPCRLPFSAGAPGACHLSLKDHSHIAYLRQLAEAGVTSVKIEGRLRGPEYAAAAVDACAAARAGRSYDEWLLQNVFSRSGFTDGYITGRRGPGMFGVRTEADAKNTREALPRLRELYRREAPRVGVEMRLTLTDAGARLAVTDGEGRTAATESRMAPAPAQKPARESFVRALEKTGGTPFYAQSVHVEGDEGRFLPAGEVGALRRAALEALLQKRSAPLPKPVAPARWTPPAPRMPQKKTWAARFSSIAQLPAALAEGEFDAVRRVTLPLAGWRDVPVALRGRTWLELPRAAFGPKEDAVRAAVAEAKEAGFAGFVAQNLAHLELLRGLRAMGGFGLNVANPLAAREYLDAGLCAVTAGIETPCAEMAAIAGAGPLAALVYGHMPLMLTRACPLQNVRTCKDCPREGRLLDRKGLYFPVRCTGPDGVRTVFNPVPLYAADRAGEVPADELELYFTIETPQRALAVLRMALAGEAFDGRLTRGLLFRRREDADE